MGQGHLWQHPNLLDGPVVSRAFHAAGERRVLGGQRAEGWEAKAAAMAARLGGAQEGAARGGAAF